MKHIKKAGMFIVSGLVLAILACGSATPTPISAPAPTTVPATQTPTPTITPTPTTEPLVLPTISPTAAPAPTVAPLPTATPLPVQPQAIVGKTGGSLKVAGFAGIPHRDVHQSIQETLTSMGPGLAYSRLLKLKPGDELAQPNLLLECDLCVSWELTSDFAYEFQLRPDVKWQQIEPVNGRVLTSDDIVFSYNRIRSPGWPNAGLFSSIGEVEAVGLLTLRVNLATADADVLLSLADGHSKIVAREVVEQYGDLRNSPVIGTGPWLWVETDDNGTRLVRNPDYFEPGLPFLDELEITAMRSLGPGSSPDSARLAAFQSGLVDIALLPPKEWEQLRTSGTEANSVLSKQSGTGVVLAMNAQAEPLTNVMVRRAILRAMDPWNYVDTLWSGQGFVSLGIPVQGTDWLLDRPEMRSQYFADPGLARDLLAGIPGEGPGKIELTVRTENFGDAYRDLEHRVVEDLRQIGFDPVVRRLNPAQFSEAVLTLKDYQIALGVVPPTSSANSFLMGLLHSQGRWNIASHQDSVLDDMIERQASEFDPRLRQELIKDIQRHVLDQAYFFSPITGASRWVFDPKVRSFQPNTALSEYLYWSRVWLDQ